MHLVIKTILITVALLAATGCSRLQFPWVYRIYVQQGNFIEKDMIDQLEVGMTPEQVRYVMGNPLISDTFHPDRWDYYFTLKRGEEQFKEYHFKVYFENNTLARWDGDFDPKDAKNDDPNKAEDETPKDLDTEGAKETKEVTPAT